MPCEGAVLSEVIPEPKPRSKAWLSTSSPLDCTDVGATVCGPEYHVRSSSALSSPSQNGHLAPAVMACLSWLRMAVDHYPTLPYPTLDCVDAGATACGAVNRVRSFTPPHNITFVIAAQ